MGTVGGINQSMGQKYHSAMPQVPMTITLMAIVMGRGEGYPAWPMILMSAYPASSHKRGSCLENISLRCLMGFCTTPMPEMPSHEKSPTSVVSSLVVEVPLIGSASPSSATN
jgi:hypothetical protein